MLLLASGSAARRAMLVAAGVPVAVLPAHVDEEPIREALVRDGAAARDIADALAEAKARKVSGRQASLLVLGADQLLVTEEGTLLGKPVSREDAADQLRALRGREHQLVSAAVIAQGGSPVWRAVDVARLTMRAFSDAFLEDYLAREGDALAGLVGGYRLEGLGVQLFSRVRGDHFTILGLPLLPVLDYLRTRGVIAQ